ncbi:putative metallohydrolase (TIGR04338 family) [Marmoricola sp. OAE513]
MVRVEDPDRKTTYDAEDMVLAWLDAADPATGEVQVSVRRDGEARTMTYTPETEPRFTRPEDVTRFTEQVLERLRGQTRAFGTRYRGREQRDVTVVAHTGWRKATYRDGMIYLPRRERGGSWALRGMVVLHELAHHLNTGVDGTIIDSHGEGFRATFVRLVEDLGWAETAAMLREAYDQVGLDRRPGNDDGMLAKVGKILRHAEGAGTEAERETFFSKAQELAAVHSIELAVARAAHEKAEAGRATPTFESVRLGHRNQRSNVRFIELILAISRANDLRCTIRGDNTGVTLYGFQGDIDVTKALYAVLVVQMVADADAYLRSGAHRPVHGQTARAAFYDGWTDRIGERLADAQRAARARTEAAQQPTGPAAPAPLAPASTALALAAKEVEVHDYFDQMRVEHGVRGTWRGSAGGFDEHSLGRGQAAADRARLGQEKELSA